MSSRPSSASTRSASPLIPLPRLASAPPTPSSETSTSTWLSSTHTRTVAIDASAYLATFVNPSATRYRGTGLSQAIHCPSLQQPGGEPYEAVRTCGAQLGSRSDLYGSADVAQDIEAVRAALEVERFDFYGFTYAAADAQAYAVPLGALRARSGRAASV
jgi:pimeloyl-ACP methyl ester carboxylesterase